MTDPNAKVVSAYLLYSTLKETDTPKAKKVLEEALERGRKVVSLERMLAPTLNYTEFELFILGFRQKIHDEYSQER
jgi:hypothetical protein